MAVFLLWKTLSMPNFPKRILIEIRDYLRSDTTRELCGLIFLYEDFHFLPISNAIDSDGMFSLPPQSYLLRKKIAAAVHSHPCSDAFPSPADKSSSRSSGIPFLIYSCLYDNFLYFDKGKCNPIKV